MNAVVKEFTKGLWKEIPPFRLVLGLCPALAVTTTAFDISVLELFLPLVAGGRVVIASRRHAADGMLLAELIDEAEPTVLQATPATWQLLIESGWEGRPSLRALCGGRELCVAAERVRELTGHGHQVMIQNNAAHGIGLPTTATIMYGHLETSEHVARHLALIRGDGVSIQELIEAVTSLGFEAHAERS